MIAKTATLLMFLPNIHCVLPSSRYDRAVPVWSPSPLHSGPLQGPSCTGSPLRSACRGPSRSRSAQRLPPSAETPSETQTRCAAFFPAHLKKMDCYAVKSYQWKWILCDLSVNSLPCRFRKGQYSFRSWSFFHHTCKERFKIYIFSL